MLNNAKIAPQLAFSHCGMFVDPEMAFKMSEKYIQDQEAKAATVTTQKEDGNGNGNNPDSDPGSGTDDQ
jgi:hypothetical protein